MSQTSTTKEQAPPQPTPSPFVSLKGSKIIQNLDPVRAMNLHLSGFAFHNNDPNRQMELHHYCSILSEDLIQCAVFDTDREDAKMIGVEYVISKKLFDSLDPQEQMLWHSHVYDIKSGSFIAPELPSPLGKELLKDLLPTYGKTWIFWQTDRGDALPLGMPQLMMVATNEGEWNEKIFKERGIKRKYDHDQYLSMAKDLPSPEVNPNADGYKHGLKMAFDIQRGKSSE